MRKTSNLNDIETFVAAADSRTLRGAAESLNVPTSTVSRSLTRLERSLNLLLVRRTQRGIRLTDAGKEYLQSCKGALRILREGAELLNRQRVAPAGVIRVSCPITVAQYVIAPILTKFIHQYPDLAIDLDCYSSLWDQEPKEDVDVFFKVRQPRDSSRKIRCYPASERGLFAAPSYLKAAGTPEDPADLASHRCIGWDAWNLSKGKRRVSPDVKFHVCISDPEVALQLALDGAGITILPLWMVLRPPTIRKQLVRVLGSWRPAPISFCALYTESSRLSPKIKAFLDFVEEYIGTEKDPRLQGTRLRDCFTDEQSQSRSKPDGADELTWLIA